MNVNHIPQTIKRAVINRATTGELVAAVPNKKIRVLAYVIGADAAVAVTFTSASTALTGVIPFVGAVLAPFSSGFWPVGHFETAAGEALNITLSSTEDVDGYLVYIEV